MESGSTDDPGEGFDPEFLHQVVGIPKPSETIRGDLLAWDGGTVLPYTHFSLAMSISRRFAYWVAWNIDGGALKRVACEKVKYPTLRPFCAEQWPVCPRNPCSGVEKDDPRLSARLDPPGIGWKPSASQRSVHLPTLLQACGWPL